MNCKPGDLAVVIRASLAENIGRLCRVQKRCADIDGQAIWLVDFGKPIRCARIRDRAYVPGSEELRAQTGCPDSWLRPIRDNDGEDQTLQWAGLPARVGVLVDETV